MYVGYSIGYCVLLTLPFLLIPSWAVAVVIAIVSLCGSTQGKDFSRHVLYDAFSNVQF